MSIKQTSKRKSPSSTAQRGGAHSARGAAPKPSRAAAVKNTTSAAAPNTNRGGIVSERMKNDLIGLLIVVVGVVLFVLIAFPADAVGARAISDGVRLFVGLGAYILPLLIIIWGIAFFVRGRLAYAPARLVIGFTLIFIGVIALFASSTPHAEASPGIIFNHATLISRGGYLGGFFAFVGLSFIGFVATNIILVALIIAGAVLIGFSISGLVERVGSRFSRGKTDEVSVEESSPSAYNLGAQQAASDKDALFAPTRLKGSPAANNLYDDAYAQGVQGTLPLEATADLGSTRRFKTAQNLETGEKSAAGNTLVLDRGAKGAADQAMASLGRSLRGKKDNGSAAAGKADAKAAAAASATLFADENFVLPATNILRVSRDKATTKAGLNELKATATRLQATLEEFGVDGEVIGWIAGPTVTLYKVSLGEGVRLNRITNLQDDIQLALAALAIRIVAPIPGTSLVGIEVPNDTRNTVLLGDVLPAAQPGPLQLAIGKDVEGDAITADLTTMPHLLIGGTTGSGKSVAINTIIMSILMRATPREARMILIDPKRVELSLYNGIPHLYVPVVTDPQQAASALSWSVVEMERRLKLFEKHGAKNIRQFNDKVADELERLAALESKEQVKQVSQKGDKDVSDIVEAEDAAEVVQRAVAATQQADQNDLVTPLPYLVIVIDELADLMMAAGKDVEFSISRLAQLARAAGLHLIVATQRPSTNVITGLIKANIVNRIAFTVASGIDSRVILDTPGAEDLVGLGDLLFGKPEYSKPMRIQGCFVSEPEIETVVNHLRAQGEPDYHEDILFTSSSGSNATAMGSGENVGEDDPLLWEAADIVVSSGLGSTSTLQRRLKVGYARAGRIMDMLEMKGIVGQPNGSKPREVLIDDVLDLETLKAFEMNDG